ncbi:MAG: hypothetical protein HY540_06875, partial [Deltaproteobacteria bacterium]|nr:hypothetical protein [Deltaproteobacteria bacterium]
ELFAREQQTLKQDQLILTDLELKTLYGSRIPPGHVITPQTAHLMVEALRQVVERGTGTRVKQLERPAAGKTGTTNDESDTWFIGFVPDLVTGVWLGFDEMKPLGKKETGGKTAAPVFISYMKEALKASETQDFTPPEAFPVKAMASLPGGSALFGGHSRIGHGSEPGAERAGDFFAEDLDQAKGGTPPPAKEKSPTSKFFDGEY